MLESMWDWLIRNSAAVQAIVAIVSGLLSVATIIVLAVTWKTIERQAKAAEDQAVAARAQAQVAKDQTKAAIDAAEAARKQSDMLSAQLEQSTAPLLVVEPDDRLGFNNYKLLNQGHGVAFQIFYWQGELDLVVNPEKSSAGISIEPVRPSTLGTGRHIYLPIPAAWTAFTVRYKGSDRETRWTVVHRDGSQDQQHWVRKLGQVFSLT